MKQAAEYSGLHPHTLRKYIDNGTIKGRRIGKHRYVDRSELDGFVGRTAQNDGKGTILYARVSTYKQKKGGNLERQVERLERYCKDNDIVVTDIVQEVASGVNERRRGLKKMMAMALKGHIGTIIIEYKDRLARFGFEYLRTYFKGHGTRIIVLDSEERSPQQELVEDLIAIVSSFSARLYGRRGARRIVKRFKEDIQKD